MPRPPPATPCASFNPRAPRCRQQLATRWHVAPASITIAEIDARVNGDSVGIRRIFALADQAAYSGQHLSTADFQQWKEDVRGQLKQAEAV